MSDITEIQISKLTKVRDCFIRSPYLDGILKTIHRNRMVSKCGGKPECALIIGEPGSGKTTLMEKYEKDHPHEEESCRTRIPVFLSEFPLRTEPRQAAISLLDDLGHELPPKGLSAPQLTKQLAKLMHECEVEIALLDEFHHLIETKSYDVLHDAVTWVKTLINISKKPVVLFGLPYSRVILDYDEQLSGRFPIIRQIEPFRVKKDCDEKVFRTFLMMLSSELPFDKVIKLHGRDFYPRLFAFSKGSMRRLRNLINFACEQAIFNNDSGLTLEHFSVAYNFYMQHIDERKDEIDVSEPLSSQPNPFSGSINDHYYKELVSHSKWNMNAQPGESRIIPATFTDKIPLRTLLKRR
ncbi:TniB family NTP-binding protein [Endozoicomonas sp. ALD040]|uniref:TniB family NTP-binding protein n=1 Tax=Endozoicomonas sp. ALD040 TaxID=3403079 RepID=UPI003BB1B761